MSDFKVNKNAYSDLNSFVLFSTSACHLCEEAVLVLSDLNQQMLVLAGGQGFSISGERVFAVNEFDISVDDELIKAYGKRIPVLIFSKDKSELAWPFDIQQAYEFIAPKLVF